MRTSIFRMLFATVFAVFSMLSLGNAQQPYPNTGATVQPTPPVAEAGTLGQPLSHGAPVAGQLAPGQVPAANNVAAPQQAIGPPFQLSPVEQQFVDQILHEWEDRGDEVRTFDCEFELWEYDVAWGPTRQDGTPRGEPMRKSNGRLTYSKPDKGSFKIEEIYRFKKTQDGQPVEYELKDKEIGAHWVCDGKAVYEYNHDKKQLVVQKLPPDMRGSEIVNGPLPFLFGAEAEKLKARYWIRSKQSDAATIWLEAYPRRQADAANYHHVEVMLERKTMLPRAIQVHMPNGKNRDVYIFQTPTVNGTMDQLFSGLFSSPRTPFGWRKVVVEAPQVQPGAPGPQAAVPQETSRQ